MDVVVIGPYGAASPSDEAGLDAVLAALTGIDALVLSARPEETEAAHACRALPFSEAARELAAAGFAVVAGDVARLWSLPGTDALLWRLFSPVTGPRVPVAAVGVGVPHPRTVRERRRLRAMAARSGAFIGRDGATARGLAAAGVPPPFWVGADLAWDGLAVGGDGCRSPHAVVCVDDWGAVASLEAVAAACSGAGLDVRVQLWPGADRGPVPVVGWAPVPSVVRLADAGAVLGTARLAVVTGRGPLMAAAAAGTPAVVVDPDDSTDELAARLGQVVVHADDPPELLAAAVGRALDERAPLAEVVAFDVAAARQTLGLLRALVDGGDPAGVETRNLRLVEA